MVIDDIETLLARARALAAPGRRRIIGISGPPGGGKSTLAARVAAALGDAAVANAIFAATGRRLSRLPIRPEDLSS